MRKPRKRSTEIRNFILDNIGSHPRDISALVSGGGATMPASLSELTERLTALEDLLPSLITAQERNAEALAKVSEAVSRELDQVGQLRGSLLRQSGVFEELTLSSRPIGRRSAEGAREQRGVPGPTPSQPTGQA